MSDSRLNVSAVVCAGMQKKDTKMNQYEYQFDVESEGIASRVVRLAGMDKRVLELGCYSGHMSKILVDRGCDVVGLEMDAEAAAAARNICTQVYEVDLDDDKWVTLLKDQPKFDVVIAADVLEHLRDPGKCLSRVRGLMKENASLIVSTPNIAHGGVIASLMQGHFKYRDTGLLDRTHVHFFTEQSLRDLLKEQGFVIGHFDFVEAGPDHPEFSEYWNQLTPELRDTILRMPNAMAFQFVVSATKLNSTVEAATLYETQRQFEITKRSIRALQDQAQAQIAVIQEEAQKHITLVEQRADTLETHLRGIEAQLRTAEQQIDTDRLQLSHLENATAQQKALIEDQQSTLTEQLDVIESQQRSLDSQRILLEEKISALAQLNAELQNTQQILHALINSSSWKLTSPLRFLARKIPQKPRWFLHVWLHRFYMVSKILLTKPISGWAEVARTRKQAQVIPVAAAAGPHFSPPVDDHSVAMPLQYDIAPWENTPSLAVVCHMYYPDLAEEFADYFSNILFPFDLYITTDTVEKKTIIDAFFSDWTKGKVEVRIAQNRGRDIAPKLISCRDVYDQYEYILHVHTKKSPHRGHENGWRSFLLDTLIGTPKTVDSVFEAFRTNPRLGMIAPQHLEDIRPYVGWGWNFEIAKQFGHRLGIPLSLDGAVDFPSGSMFWARSAALKPLLDIHLTFEDFPEEAGQIDGTLGHVIERFYFLCAEKAGFEWMKIALKAMHPQFADRILDIQSREQLQQFMQQHTQNLLETHENAEVLYTGSAPALTRSQKSQYSRAYQKSSYRTSMNLSQFIEQAALLASGQQSEIDFDEKFYLEVNPDVAQQVKIGAAPCGYVHYCLSGQFEGRLWSDTQLTRQFRQRPRLAQGFAAPINLRSSPVYGPDLHALPESDKPFLLIFFSHLQDDLFFAGYTEFFKDFLPVFDAFDRVVLSVATPHFNPKLAARYSNKIEVIHDSALSQLRVRPNVIVSFNSELLLKARDIFGDLPRTIYYCQDFEAGFFPMGTSYVRSEMAIASSRNIIVSSALLKKFLQQRGLLTELQNVYVTTPGIDTVEVVPEKNKRIFFYFRPEQFNARNLPELLMETVEQFCAKHTGYELYLLGTVDTCLSYSMNGNQIFVISKLSKDDYIRFLKTCDAAVSMIYSAHPGVIAFQTAASGIPTVTNVFDNRDAEFLQSVSGNIVPFDPVRERLLDRLEVALAMQKGTPSFNRDLYQKMESVSLAQYVDAVLHSELS